MPANVPAGAPPAWELEGVPADDPDSDWLAPLPADDLPDDDWLAAPDLDLAWTGWRPEVTKGGRRWQWRKGSGKNRQSRPGGTFASLPADRQEAYERNKQTERERKDAARRRKSGQG